MSLPEPIIVIPMRLESTRLPQKVLQELNGQALCIQVIKAALTATESSYEVIAAVDDNRVKDCIESAKLSNVTVVMTDPNCPSGTDRVLQAITARKGESLDPTARKDESLDPTARKDGSLDPTARKDGSLDPTARKDGSLDPSAPGAARKGANLDLDLDPNQRIINIQGDMPQLNAVALKKFIHCIQERNDSYWTLARTWPNGVNPNDPSKVKCLRNAEGYAAYFSRAELPFPNKAPIKTEALLHVGIYAYTYEYLQRFCALKERSWEQAESLEQLRALQAGDSLYVVETSDCSEYDFRGIDLPADLEQARAQKA